MSTPSLSTLRRRAARQGYRIWKVRRGSDLHWDYGPYTLINNNMVALRGVGMEGLSLPSLGTRMSGTRQCVKTPFTGRLSSGRPSPRGTCGSARWPLSLSGTPIGQPLMCWVGANAQPGPADRQSWGRLEEKEVVGQMGPVEAEGLDGSGDQLEGDGRTGPQEAPQWATNCGRITPGEWRPASSQVNQRSGDLHVRVAPVALDGNDAQAGLGSQDFVLMK